MVVKPLRGHLLHQRDHCCTSAFAVVFRPLDLFRHFLFRSIPTPCLFSSLPNLYIYIDLALTPISLQWTPDEKYRHESREHAEHDDICVICVKVGSAEYERRSNSVTITTTTPIGLLSPPRPPTATVGR